jgi:hypothetical protein
MISTSLAWGCENLFAHHSLPSPSYPPYYCLFTPVEASYGIDLFKDNYLFLLPAADLRMDPALRPRPGSSVAFAYLVNALQPNHSTERRHIYSPSVFRCDIRSTAQIGMCFRFYLYGRIFDNLSGFLYLHVEQFVLILWPGEVGRSANYN